MSVLLAFLLFLGSQQPAEITGFVQDETDQPVAGVDVILQSGNITMRAATDELGKFRFDPVPPGQYTLTFNRTGFFQLSNYPLEAKPGPNDITVTLNHEYEVRSQLDVLSAPHEIIPEQMRYQEQLAGYEIRENPVPNSHNLQNALPALPGVVQDNAGQLHVAGARMENTLYTLDGFQINDPATGALDARVNVDTVREADMTTGRYGTQFSNAATGVLALHTDVGDDHRRFGITNFFPALSTQRGVHLGNWYPRITISGPLKKGRAWFSDAASIQHDFTLVRELPPGSDISQQWSGDNLLRGQYNLSSDQSLQANFLYNAATATNVGLNAFAPAATTFDLHTHRYFISATDQITIRDGIIVVGIASDRNHADSVPQGSQPFVLTPTGPRGNYFQNQVENGARWQGLADVILAGRHWHGNHEVRAGFHVDRAEMDQASVRSPVLVQQADTTLVRKASFLGNGIVSARVRQAGTYFQDAWELRRGVFVQSSFRIDENSFVGSVSAQPRFVLSWIPKQQKSKFSVGWGLYYEPVYPALIAQASDQSRQDVFLDPQQRITALLVSTFHLGQGLHQPFFEMSSAEWQKQWNDRTSSTVHFMRRNEHSGLAYEDVSADAFVGALQLRAGRNDRYDSAEITLRRSLRKDGEVMADYTYSRSRSNQIFTYSVEDLVIATQAAGRLPWDTPNRVISRGAFPTRIWDLLFSYFAEYHTGFPFSAVDSRYVTVGAPNGFRYPAYFSLNIGAEKRFPFYGRQWAVRLSVINVTGHHNFNSVINNVDAPNFLTFAGGQSRAFTARLRLVSRS